MSMLKITQGVPLPKGKTVASTKALYPFSKMRKGDSFFAPKRKITTVSSCATKFGKSSNKKFACRTEGDGVRCWCLGYKYPKRTIKSSTISTS